VARRARSIVRYIGRALLLIVLACSTTADAGTTSNELSFEMAHQILEEVSDQLSAAGANVRGKRNDAEALKWLRGPQVDLDVKEIRIQKTVDIPLAPLNQFLSQLPNASTVPLPDEIKLRDRGNKFRPEVSATLPLYTGGKIGAIQDTAAGGVAQATADARIEHESLTVQLVQSYFGQALAQRVAGIRREVLNGLEQHLKNAVQMERQGMASKSQHLQAQVARDEAARESVKADDDLVNARIVLANLLHEASGVSLTTPLFVISDPISKLHHTVEEGVNQHPQLERLDAIRNQSNGALRIEESKFLPQVYLFGQYDLYRHDALLTEPDWVFGIGLKYALFSNTDRSKSISAARDRQAQIDAGIRQAKVDLNTQSRVAFNRLETAQRQFQLLNSNTDLAVENLRLQELSFKEGQATSIDVVDARLSLGRAKVERAAAAYQFDVALAQLLNAIGSAATFKDYIRLADKVIDNE
jgi:outer membrane protein TolC